MLPVADFQVPPLSMVIPRGGPLSRVSKAREGSVQKQREYRRLYRNLQKNILGP